MTAWAFFSIFLAGGVVDIAFDQITGGVVMLVFAWLLAGAFMTGGDDAGT